MAKWMWQWLTQNKWWKGATPIRHESFRPWEENSASKFWTDIAKIKVTFFCSIQFQVGNGAKTFFWEDVWLGEPFKYQFPILYQRTTMKAHTIAELHHSGSWQIIQEEYAQLQELHSIRALLRNVTLQPLLDDSVTWCRGTTCFTVQSQYYFLINGPMHYSPLVNIWKIKAPPRVQIFAWLMLRNSILTVDNLKRRGWQMPNMCCMCYREEEESVQHLFQDCQIIQQIRRYIHNETSLITFASVQYQIGDPNILLDGTQTQWSQLEITTRFVIWRERCSRIFSDERKTHIEIVREILSEFKEWFKN